MKYYLHSTNSFQDEKISELFMRFGYEGLGLFYTCLERLAMQEKPVKTDVLKAQLKVKKRLEKCWKFMEEIELISSKNGETFNENILNFSEKYKIKKIKNAKRILEWRESQEVAKNVTYYESVRNARKVKESKVNINTTTKVDSIIKSVSFDFCDESFLESLKLWLEYKKEKKQVYKSQKQIEILYKKLLELSENDPLTAKKIVEQSIANNWAGLFELKTNNHNATNNNRFNNQSTAEGRKQQRDAEFTAYITNRISNPEPESAGVPMPF